MIDLEQRRTIVTLERRVVQLLEELHRAGIAVPGDIPLEKTNTELLAELADDETGVVGL
jgi:hypothetical protein